MIPNKFETTYLEFLKTLETLNLQSCNDIVPKLTQVPEYVVNEFQKHQIPLEYLHRPLRDKDQALVLINTMDTIHFMDKIYKAETGLFDEININLKRSKNKEDILIYLYEVDYAISRILKGFYVIQLPVEIEANVLTYRITFPEKLRHNSPILNDFHAFVYEFDDLMKYFRVIIERIHDKVVLLLKQISIMSENRFNQWKGQKHTTTVVALYYYYMIEAGAKPLFQSHKKMTVKEAMRRALKEDGFEYINVNTFYNLFYAIGKGKNNDPLKVQNLRKVIDLLKDQKARQMAIRDQQSIILQ